MRRTSMHTEKNALNFEYVWQAAKKVILNASAALSAGSVKNLYGPWDGPE